MTGFSPVAARPLSSRWARYYPPVDIYIPPLLYQASVAGVQFSVRGKVEIPSTLLTVDVGTWRFPLDQGFRPPSIRLTAICGDFAVNVDGYSGIVPKVTDFYTDIQPEADLGAL